MFGIESNETDYGPRPRAGQKEVAVPMPSGLPADPLAHFHPVVRAWFSERFGAPSPPQALGWPLIAADRHCLITAPTGSGKTLAAFLQCLNALWLEGNPEPGGVRVLYISPLKALNADIERNLQEPLAGVLAHARAMGVALPELRTAVRTGDTDPTERARILRKPPHVLITTPESLYLMLTAQRARELLRTVKYVIVDEIHAVLGSKRGVHLALSLERLEALCPQPPVRIGLTATVRPLERAARFLGGQADDGTPRRVTVADAGLSKHLDLRVEVPLDDMAHLPDDSVWPALHQRLLELIQTHRSTLIFVNNRATAEKLAARLNDLAGAHLVRTHHGSMSRGSRKAVEEALKAGRLPALVATGTLELGIDIGAIDLVVQVESPKSVARGLQRVGRSGHLLQATSKGRILPKFRADLVEAAAVARSMLRGQLEEVQVPENCLDVLAQQLTAMAAAEPWADPDLLALVRRAYPYRNLSRPQFEGVLHMLAGRYSAAEFTDLRPRITWDRVNGQVTGRPGSGTLAMRSGGTIPDRGLYGIYLAGTETKLGEIDEEFGFETHPGEIFLFGTSTWRTERVTHDRVEVSPAPGHPYARYPFWKGEAMGRPAAVGRMVGDLCRRAAARLDDPDLPAWLQAEYALDPRAATNLRQYLWDLQEHLGTIPTDRQLVVEWFPEELGGWRVVMHSPYGAPLHAAWAMALRRKYRDWAGTEAGVVYNDEGLLLRLPPLAGAPPLEPLTQMTATEAETLVMAELASSALLGARFRMAAERALLLPRHGVRRRTPLWLQRQKAKDLLQLVEPQGDFPILLEAYRECLQEVLDLPGLQQVLHGLQSGEISLAVRATDGPSAAAAGLIWNFTATYLYEGDSPRAERATAALSLEKGLLLDLLGSGRMRALLDRRALAEVEAQLQHTAPDRQARTADELHDLLLRLGDLSPAELAVRVKADFLPELAQTGRVTAVNTGGETRWIATEDLAQYAGALAGACADRLEILRRYARTRGPFTLAWVAARYGWDPAKVRETLAQLTFRGELAEGGFTPGSDENEWCDLTILERLRRKTLGILRREIEPRTPAEYARFLVRYQGLTGSRPGGLPGLRRTLEQLQGVWLPAAAWERDVLPRRLTGYQPGWLDQLLAGGEFRWVGRGDRVAFFGGQSCPGPVPAAADLSPVATAVLAALQRRGASFLGALAPAANLTPPEALTALWELVAAGLVTNDTFTPLRERQRGGGAAAPRRGMSGRQLRAALGQAVAGGTGRWSLVEPVAAEPDPEAEGYAQAELLLQRYGVLTREAAVAEGVPWGHLYPVLKRLELSGRVRQGYFVSGLTGVQYARPEVVDQLRAVAPAAAGPIVLAAADPANPWGALLPLPEPAEGRLRLALVPGTYLVLLAGEPVLVAEGYGRRLVPLATLTPERLPAALGALHSLLESAVPGQSVRRLEVQRWADRPVTQSPVATALEQAGFERSYRGFCLYRR